jgi:hypothetical protein
MPAAVSLMLLEALFMQISGVSLTLTWPLRLCLLKVLLGASHCYKLSPFQAHWGRWHCPGFLRLACLFTVHVGSGPSPFSCGVFLPLPLLQAFQVLVAGRVPPLLPSLSGFFIYCSVRYCPSPIFGAQGALPSLLCVFLLLLLSIQFFFLFSLGGGWSVQGAMLIWPRVVCGSTGCLLAHLVVCIFPSHLGAGIWQCRSPPDFSL